METIHTYPALIYYQVLFLVRLNKHLSSLHKGHSLFVARISLQQWSEW